LKIDNKSDLSSYQTDELCAVVPTLTAVHKGNERTHRMEYWFLLLIPLINVIDKKQAYRN